MNTAGHVAVLMSARVERAVDDALVTRLRKRFPELGDPNWLAERVAVEFALPAGLAAGIRTELIGRPIDSVCVPLANRRKRLLISDMDSTIIGQECIDELAALAGVGEKVARITERSMRGELDFEQSLRERVALLAGLPEIAITEVLEKRVTLNPGARELVMTMRAHGAHTALVSGGFRQFTSAVAAQSGFAEERANTLLIKGGRLTGRLAEPVLDADAKRQALVEMAAAHTLLPADVLAIGDGANDIPMLSEAGVGIAYRAKLAVETKAKFALRHADLTGALFIQGYRESEFVA